jgi:hypothetical protein
MVIRKVILENAPTTGDILSFSQSGINFGAEFIKNNKLEKKVAVSFFTDDEDPYWLGFQFYDEKVEDSLSLMIATRKSKTAGRTVKANDLFNNNRLLQKVKEEKKRSLKRFEIKYDRLRNCYSLSLRPLFENSVRYSEISVIPNDALGIYRCRDVNDALLYIGMGKIKDRLKVVVRKEWDIDKIEYSVLDSEEACKKWESYYIDKYKYEFGTLPPFNRIRGKSSTEEQ